MATRMQQRRGTAAQWTTANTVLAAGEIGFEIDTNQFKIGDGVNVWPDLDYFASFDAISDLIDGAPEALNTLNELAAAINDNPSFGNALTSAYIAADAAVTNAFATADIAVLAAAEADANTKTSTAYNNAISYTDGAVSAEAELRSNAISTHSAVTANVHGIANTLALATTSDVLTAATNAEYTAYNNAVAYANSLSFNYDAANTAANAVSDHNNLTSNVHGIANTLALITNSGNQTIDGTLTLSGLIVNGNTTTVSTVDLVVEDPMIQLSSNQYDADLVDIGFHGSYGTAGGNVESHLHTGLVRDVSDGKYKLFHNAPIPVGNEIDFSQSTRSDLVVGHAYASGLHANAITLIANASSVTETELFYLANSTSNIQGQIDTLDSGLDTKAPLASPTFTGLVTVASNGIAFSDGTQSLEGVPSRTTIHQKTDSYTLASLNERDDLIEISKATGTTLTIPADSTLNYPIGTSIDVVQTGAGQVTIAGAGGVTVNATPGLKLRAQWSSATLFKRAANTWLVMGDLSA